MVAQTTVEASDSRQMDETSDLVGVLARLLGIRSEQAARRLAEEITHVYGDERSLIALTARDLMAISGIGPVRAHRVEAAFRLSRWSGDGSAPDTHRMVSEIHRIRCQVPCGETALLAHRPYADTPPSTLALGIGLTEDAPLGGFVAQMLSEPGPEWWVILCRPGGRPTTIEKNAAKRLVRAARLVGLPVGHVICANGAQHWFLTDAPAVASSANG